MITNFKIFENTDYSTWNNGDTVKCIESEDGLIIDDLYKLWKINTNERGITTFYVRPIDGGNLTGPWSAVRFEKV